MFYTCIYILIKNTLIFFEQIMVTRVRLPLFFIPIFLKWMLQSITEMSNAWSNILFSRTHFATDWILSFLWFGYFVPIEDIADAVLLPKSFKPCRCDLSVLLVRVADPMFRTGSTLLLFALFREVFLPTGQISVVVVAVAAGLPHLLSVQGYQVRCTFRAAIFECTNSPFALLFLRDLAIIWFLFIVIIFSNFISMNIYVLDSILPYKIF